MSNNGGEGQKNRSNSITSLQYMPHEGADESEVLKSAPATVAATMRQSLQPSSAGGTRGNKKGLSIAGNTSMTPSSSSQNNNNMNNLGVYLHDEPSASQQQQQQ